MPKLKKDKIIEDAENALDFLIEEEFLFHMTNRLDSEEEIEYIESGWNTSLMSLRTILEAYKRSHHA